MDAYIPVELFKSPGNEQKVHEILNKYYFSDLIDVDSDIGSDRDVKCRKELEQIGESHIMDHLNSVIVNV